MKQVIFIACILIFWGAAWTLYLWWDTTRFVGSLPKAPDRSNIENATDRSSQQKPTVEDKNRDVLREAATQQDPPHVDEEVPIDTKHRPVHVGEPHAPPQIITSPGSEEAIKDLKEESESSVFIPDLSAEEHMAQLREVLVKKHGDIPEIDIYFKYMSPVYEAIAAGESQVVIESTPEETVELNRARMVLYPDESSFRNRYQHALKVVAEQKRRRERLQ